MGGKYIKNCMGKTLKVPGIIYERGSNTNTCQQLWGPINSEEGPEGRDSLTCGVKIPYCSLISSPVFPAASDLLPIISGSEKF